MVRAQLLSGLWIIGLLAATRLAAADAQQCVSHNNDGVDLRAKHKLLASRAAYRECVADPGCPSVVRAECEAALSELKTAIPTLLISVLDEQRHDVVAATLKVDGRSVALDGLPLELDPGPYELVATGQATSTSMRVVAVENEANRQVELLLRAPSAWMPEPGQGLGPQRELASAAPAPAAHSRVPIYVLGGVGAAAAASFAYFAITGHSSFNQLEQCKPDCSRSDVRDVRTKYLVADVSLGVSVVALAAAGYLLLRSAPERPVASGSVSLAVVAAPQSAGLSLRWVE
ncbi:MAG TPA: hypothetical protein VHW01_17400 [Polyangiaceae bacterium]|nr:hypothetical protein [Polyangiaceae bacterium]